MKYKHDWKIVPPVGLYDDWYQCTICNKKNMESADNPASSNPEYGCIPRVERIPEEGHIMLPNGCALYWRPNEVGGREYYSDEIPCGVSVWDTALINEDTLLAAILQEHTIRTNERYWAEQDKKK